MLCWQERDCWSCSWNWKTAAVEKYLPLQGVCLLRAQRPMYHCGLRFDPHLKSSTGLILMPIILPLQPLSLYMEVAFRALSLVGLFPIWIYAAWCSSECLRMNGKAVNVHSVLHQFLTSPVWDVTMQLLLKENGSTAPLPPKTHVGIQYCAEICWKTETGISPTLRHVKLWWIFYFKGMAKCNTGKLSPQPFCQGILCPRYLEYCIRTWEQVKLLIAKLNSPKFDTMSVEWKR